ncbi:MAG: carbon-nitrogen hydrolase family protein [Kofleriaceae bacterium]
MKARVAAAAWPIEEVGSMAAWRQKLDDWLTRAADGGAVLAVIPEYASMELTSVLPASSAHDLQAQLRLLQPLLGEYRAAYAALARRCKLAVVAGSFPELDEPSRTYRNRARVFLGAMDAAEHYVEKLQMTRFEDEQWGIAPGARQLVLPTAAGRIGVAICYDSEFPLISRRLIEAGAQVLCVPSCTDSTAGYHRVRVACQARALENQCYALQAPTVGSAPWSIAVDENIGAAGCFGPPDRGFPSDGVLALGTMNQPAWLFADLDLALLEQVRRDGAVLLHRDWRRDAHLRGAVEVVPDP